MELLDRLRLIHRLKGDTFSSAEVIGMVGQAADEIEQLREIRETLIKALMIATGASREAIEAAPYSNAYRAEEERTAALAD